MGALKQTDTKTCCVLVVDQHSFRPIRNCTPRNMNLKTKTSKPTTHQNMSSFGGRPNAHFNASTTWAPKRYPTKTCNISGTRFQPHQPIFHVPPCNPHPWWFKPFFNFTSSSCIFLPNFNIFIKACPLEI